MADETHLTHPPEAAKAQPPLQTEAPPLQQPEPVSEPPLASVELDLPKESLPSTETSLPVEENLKEAVTVVEKDAPLEPPSPEAPLSTEHVTVTATEKDAAAAPVSQPLGAALAVSQDSPKTELKEVIETEKEKPVGKKLAPESMVSFKEESNIISDLSQSEQKSLEELKNLVQEALKNGEFSDSKPENLAEEVSIWGVPLLVDNRSDVILLKFLRARDFIVKESFAMLQKTLKWRREFNVDECLKEDLGDDLEKVVFMHGHDKEGHPVCYNVYGEFQNKELYAKTFADEDKRKRFMRWRIQFLERSIRKLDFSPGGVNTIFQISDLKNSPGFGKKELRIATKQALDILQDNYPEFVAKQVENDGIFLNLIYWDVMIRFQDFCEVV